MRVTAYIGIALVAFTAVFVFLILWGNSLQPS
jgi:hypothetical protein